MHPGCPELVEPGTKYCEKHKKPAEPRGANERGYGYAWQKARKAFLYSKHLKNFKNYLIEILRNF